MSRSLVESVRAARKVGTPLLAITTPDVAATVAKIVEDIGKKGSQPAKLRWDRIQGLRALNTEGEAALREIVDGPDIEGATIVPVDMLVACRKLPERALVFMLHAHRYLDDAPTVQAIWNLRDEFKATGATLVLLGPSFQLPAELSQDVVELDDPYPTRERLGEIVTAMHVAWQQPEPDADTVARAVRALLGLSEFPAEQAVAMSINGNGLNIDELWNRKRQMIEQTPGLSVWRGGETVQDVIGLNHVITSLTDLFHGPMPPECIVFVDEIEKMLAGATGAVGDSSGVSQAFLQYMLTHMENTSADGIILLGPAGSGKSLVGKAAGSIGGVPVISLDANAMKSSLVGESARLMRQAFNVVNAIGEKRQLWIATSNRIAALPPELLRRFKYGIFFVDLPSPEMRAALWEHYLKRYGLTDVALPPSEGWTGAEIRNCCEVAYKRGKSLIEVASQIVPVCKSAAKQIEALRREADGVYADATVFGPYRMTSGLAATTAGRRVQALE